jgi:hypothetical protein
VFPGVVFKSHHVLTHNFLSGSDELPAFELDLHRGGGVAFIANLPFLVREASGEGRVTDGDDVALFEVDGVEEGKVQPSRLPLRLIGNVLLAS